MANSVSLCCEAVQGEKSESPLTAMKTCSVQGSINIRVRLFALVPSIVIRNVELDGILFLLIIS